MKRLLRPAARASLLLLLLAGGGLLAYRYNYPYGARLACLPVVLEALRSFAAANGGNFPSKCQS